MHNLLLICTLIVSSFDPNTLSANIVINEIFYHAPNDADDLEWIEIHNSGGSSVDLSGWKLAKGVRFDFPRGTTIGADDFLVVCKRLDVFQDACNTSAIGEFDQRLSNSGEGLELIDATGKRVDAVEYKDAAPWPVAPDGYSSSLERISPLANGDTPVNWAASPLPEQFEPAGTPGAQNVNYSPTLPPVITGISITPEHPKAGQSIRVTYPLQWVHGQAAVPLRSPNYRHLANCLQSTYLPRRCFDESRAPRF